MNAMLSQAAAEVEGVQVINIYDYPVAPDVYRDVVKQAKGIVYEFPFYWMSAPHLLKQWTDEVFMAFTQEGLIPDQDLTQYDLKRLLISTMDAINIRCPSICVLMKVRLITRK